MVIDQVLDSLIFTVFGIENKLGLEFITNRPVDFPNLSNTFNFFMIIGLKMMFLKNLNHIFSQDSILSSLIKLVVLPSLLLSLFLAISLDPTLWVSSEIHHFYIELIAVILGSALSFYYILRYRVLRDRFSLFVGIGFFISVSIDLFHVIVSFALIENILFIKYFIPQTWFAGRFFLGAMLLIAILKYSSLSQREEIEQLTDIRSPSYTQEETGKKGHY